MVICPYNDDLRKEKGYGSGLCRHTPLALQAYCRCRCRCRRAYVASLFFYSNRAQGKPLHLRPYLHDPTSYFSYNICETYMSNIIQRRDGTGIRIATIVYSTGRA